MDRNTEPPVKELEPWANRVYEEHLSEEEKKIIDIVRSNDVSESFMKVAEKRFSNPFLLRMFPWKRYDMNTVERKNSFYTAEVSDLLFPKYEEMVERFLGGD